MYVTVTHASDPARASRLRRFLTCPCIAPLEFPPFLFPPTRRNALTRRFAGSASTRRRECRRAAAGVHSWHVDARVTRRAPRAWGALARARGGVRVPRAASGEYSVLFGRESAPIAEGAGKLEKREIARAIQKFRGFYCQFLVHLL